MKPLPIDKRILNYLVIIVLSLITFGWTFWIFHRPFDWSVVAVVIVVRMVMSTLIFKDYSLSWSKVSPKTYLIKSIVYIAAFALYMPFFYGKVHVYFFVSELFAYLFLINLLMYLYYYYINKSKIKKNKEVVIYGAGKAGLKLEEEFKNSPYKIRCFVDDKRSLHGRSIDGIPILSKKKLCKKGIKYDLLVIAIPSAPSRRIKEIYEELHGCFHKVKILPSLDAMLLDEPYAKQLKNISVEDLLARHPKDLDKAAIAAFLKDKSIMVTGAGGSIGSEIVRQCIKYGAKKLILLDHSEYNLYQIEQEVRQTEGVEIACVMQSVVDKALLAKTFENHRPQIVIHAAAYKHVPLVEENIEEAIINNIIGTKNCMDLAIGHGVEKFILISTDKAVRPTNVMGTTKRICELYAQNVPSDKTEIVAVRFGNVLGSSGSVIPKFREQIGAGEPITVTHPDITRYFMLIPEACELVLQAGAIGKGGEIFILDMGEPIKIVDLAKKMIELSGRDDIEIVFTGLRPGEKLYEELLIDESDMHTAYESITVAAPTHYDIDKLLQDIEELMITSNKLQKLQEIVPEFHHQKNES